MRASKRGAGVDEREIAKVLQQDLSKGTEAFRDALLRRCLDVLDSDNDGRSLDDDELEMLAAAGDLGAMTIPKDCQ